MGTKPSIMASSNASSLALSNASFEDVGRMRKQEILLMSEIDRLREDRTAAEQERDAAHAYARQVEANCEKLLEDSKLREKHSLDVCRILRAENERMRSSGAVKEEAMHKELFGTKHELRATQNAAEQRAEVMMIHSEQNHAEITSARSALRTAVEEHNMMAQEYYGTMEKFSEMNEELEWSKGAHQMVSGDCEDLELELFDQGNAARRRLGDIHQESNSMQLELELRGQETAHKSMQSHAVFAEQLMTEKAEVVATRAKAERALHDAEKARTSSAVMSERCEVYARRCDQLSTNLREQEDLAAVKERRAKATAVEVCDLREELGCARDEVQRLNLDKEQMEMTLRSSVDWQKYREPTFLAQSKFSSLNTIRADTYSGYCDMKDLRHEM